MKIAKLMYHPFEEDIISGVDKGYKGTYAIFFYGCNMHCIYCQNSAISRVNAEFLRNLPSDKVFTANSLSDKMIEAEKNGAYSISFITGVFYIDEIVETIKLARKKGLTLPIVYNSSAYEKVEHIRKLDGLVDIYLPDYRYNDNILSKKLSNVSNYVKAARDCISEMYRQCNNVVVRLLVLPLHTKDAMERLKYLYDTYNNKIYISILSQYTPIAGNENLLFPELSRRLTNREYEKVVKYAINIGISKAYIQDIDSASSCFIPDFS